MYFICGRWSIAGSFKLQSQFSRIDVQSLLFFVFGTIFRFNLRSDYIYNLKSRERRSDVSVWYSRSSFLILMSFKWMRSKLSYTTKDSDINIRALYSLLKIFNWEGWEVDQHGGYQTLMNNCNPNCIEFDSRF